MFLVGPQTQDCWQLRLLTKAHTHDRQSINFLC
jgi:hypothetical protein